MTTSAEVVEALSKNKEARRGRAQSARAEELVELATATGDRPLIVTALHDLIEAYNHSGENDKILVPFARAIHMWDEHPEDFDAYASYALHWYFKWVTGGMICQPGVPISTIRRWLDDMTNRYRKAGHGMHAVYSERFEVEFHLGDYEAAAQTFTRWASADRDQMSDCRACERSNQGDWHVHQGADGAALETWAPVIDGALRCAEEPHRTLAKSLMPLARLGRMSQARANHLRGYRMARGNPAMRKHIGDHIEFAALTGNEARGLEMLTEHAGWLTPDGEGLLARLGFLEAVIILMRRLVATSHADLAIPTPRNSVPSTTAGDLLKQVEGEASDIVRRFDRRNGTSAVGDRTRVRLDQSMLPSTVILGLKATPLPGRPDEIMDRAKADEQPDHCGNASMLEAKTSLSSGDYERAGGLIRQAIDSYLEAATPWATGVPFAILAEMALSCDDPAEAERCATTGLHHGGGMLEPDVTGRLFHLLAEACWRQGGREDEVVDHALSAAERLDADDPGAAARARALASFAFHRSGRSAEAAAILDVALADLERYGDDAAVVRARRVYGMCLHDLGEHRHAAQVLLSAASIAQTWEDQTPHASLAHATGGVLEAAGLVGEATRAYERAEGLWRDLGDYGSMVRAMRARAWLMSRGDNPDWAGGHELLEAALQAIPETPLTSESAAEDRSASVERRETLRQLAEYLAGWLRQAEHPDEVIARRALEAADRAATGYVQVGAFAEAASVLFTAAWVESESLGEGAAAVARVRALREASDQRGDLVIVKNCDRFLEAYDN